MADLIAEKLKAIGIDKIVSLPMCAEALGVSTQTVKNIARREGSGLEIIRVSERRCGVRQSVLDRFLETRKSAVTVTRRRGGARNDEQE